MTSAAYLLPRSCFGTTKALAGGSCEPLTRAFLRGRYWDRTSDLFGVKVHRGARRVPQSAAEWHLSCGSVSNRVDAVRSRLRDLFVACSSSASLLGHTKNRCDPSHGGA